jgi:uncharacterized protein (DUF362 family)/Pyruvate/2-oxoacid:ferredoxin oxidoreductase delta subunit
MTTIQIRRIDSYSLPQLSAAVEDFLSNVHGPKIHRSKRVLIKPNLLGAFEPEKAVTTHPAVVEALVLYFLDKGKEVWIGDSPGGGVNMEEVWRKTGMRDIAERHPVKLVNLSASGFREVESGGIRFKLSEVLWQCGIVVNVAKMKTHGLMAFTGSLKNLYGLIPGLVKMEMHGQFLNTQDFARMLVALYSAVKSRITYNLIDGITGMDGDGPSAGRVRNFKLLLGSASIPALDLTAAKMMGFKMNEVPYLSTALHKDGLLPSRISVPTSFRDFRLPDVDIRFVKTSSEIMRLMPKAMQRFYQRFVTAYPLISPRCKKCGVCVRSCPVQAISPATAERFPKIDTRKCIHCMCCHEMCPHKAVDLHKSFMAKVVMR